MRTPGPYRNEIHELEINLIKSKNHVIRLNDNIIILPARGLWPWSWDAWPEVSASSVTIVGNGCDPSSCKNYYNNYYRYKNIYNYFKFNTVLEFQFI